MIMKKLLMILLLFTQLFGGKIMNIYDIEVKNINGQNIKLDKYNGRVMLIVNVASNCGYTDQYVGLQELHEKYSSKGLSILGFPCNQFLSQEPGTEEEIKNFCMSSFGVEFDMFSKIDVNGENTHPLYKYLKKNSDGFITDTIKWNFTKFLVDRDGKVLKRYSPSTTPAQIEADIEKLVELIF
jgi:glutathione peroxidase